MGSQRKVNRILRKSLNLSEKAAEATIFPPPKDDLDMLCEELTEDALIKAQLEAVWRVTLERKNKNNEF